MKSSLFNLKLELKKYKSMLYCCKTDENLLNYIKKEIDRIQLEINMINESKKRRK